MPIAWLAANKWLQNYPYRITLSWWIFAIAGLLVVIVAFATVSFQALKAAMANPVKNLRTE
jgi:putative ABC transport system permease protein